MHCLQNLSTVLPRSRVPTRGPSHDHRQRSTCVVLILDSNHSAHVLVGTCYIASYDPVSASRDLTNKHTRASLYLHDRPTSPRPCCNHESAILFGTRTATLRYQTANELCRYILGLKSIVTAAIARVTHIAGVYHRCRQSRLSRRSNIVICDSRGLVSWTRVVYVV